MTHRILVRMARLGTFALTLCAVMLLAPEALASVRTDAPARVDPFSGIVDRTALQPGDPAILLKPKMLRAAVLLSENTKTHLAWCKEQTAGLGGVDRAFGSFFGGAQAMAESDRLHMLAYGPKFVTDAVTLPLAQRFASLKVVSSMDEFQRGDFDVLVVVDVSFVNTHEDGFVFTKYETGTYVNAYFLGPGKQILGKVETGETRPIERNTFLASVAQLRQETLDRYQTALTATLGPVAINQPVPPVAVAPTANMSSQGTVKDRLKILDDLVKQGLLTPEEAAAKRADILKAL